nr:MAG TPA: hypothetical protein [Caudoviricetes sp.]
MFSALNKNTAPQLAELYKKEIYKYGKRFN